MLQSFAPSEFAAGGIPPGETKCDMRILPSGSRIADEIRAARVNGPDTTVLSDTEIALASGVPAVRIESDISVGPMVSFFTTVQERVVVLSCFGDFRQVDEIGSTIDGCE